LRCKVLTDKYCQYFTVEGNQMKLSPIMIYQGQTGMWWLRLEVGHTTLWLALSPFTLIMRGFNWPRTAYRTDSECWCDYCHGVPDGTWVFDDTALHIHWCGWHGVDRGYGQLNDDGTVTWRTYWRWPFTASFYSCHG
jgi:hypothetical protein